MRHILRVAALLACGLATPLAAENYALLVGVSDYPELGEDAALNGPANDVALVRSFLTSSSQVAFAEGNVTVLADGVEGADAPTAEAIRSGLTELAERAGEGDFVYLHFAGLGAQVPARDDASEPDGLNEVFLPADAGRWDAEAGEIRNALGDDELGDLLAQLRQNGADVWAVFDTAFGGTSAHVARNGTGEVRSRKASPEMLGLPDAPDEEAGGTEAEDPRARPEPPLGPAELGAEGDEAAGGGLTLFFAARTPEQTAEMRLPPRHPERRAQGIFTYALFKTLAERPGGSYRELARNILREYGIANLTRTTPVFAGDLDLPVLGGTPERRILQWPAEREGDLVRVSAGTLHGLEPGAELLMLETPEDADERAIGRYRVSEADTFSAELDVVTGPGNWPEGAVLRKVSEALDYSLRVALPEEGSAPARRLEAAVAQIAAKALVGPRVSFVPAGEPADLRLAVLPDSPRPNAIWFLPASGMVDRGQLAATPSVSTADKDVEDLARVIARNVGRFATTINLMKMAAAVSDPALPVEVTFRAGRYDRDAQKVVEGSHHALDPLSVPRVLPGDVVGATLENGAEVPVDYNILYVGSDFSLTFLGNGRLEPGDSLSRDYVLVDPAAFGRERLIAVLTPATAQSAVESLSFLAQEGVQMLRGGTGMAAMLGEAGLGESAQGSVAFHNAGGEENPGPAIRQLDLETVPQAD
ncbi:hypothetical protein E0K89_019860 [Aquicoccus sp. SCR17]|nr:hypothetical protein [Carideicomes alvinocaridis]